MGRRDLRVGDWVGREERDHFLLARVTSLFDHEKGMAAMMRTHLPDGTVVGRASMLLATGKRPVQCPIRGAESEAWTPIRTPSFPVRQEAFFRGRYKVQDRLNPRPWDEDPTTDRARAPAGEDAREPAGPGF